MGGLGRVLGLLHLHLASSSPYIVFATPLAQPSPNLKKLPLTCVHHEHIRPKKVHSTLSIIIPLGTSTTWKRLQASGMI